MILSILGIAFVIVASILVYRNARDYGRNGAVWALGTFFFGIGLQWVVPVALVIVIGIILLLTGVPEAMLVEELDAYGSILGIGGLILSVVAMMCILKYTSTIPEEQDSLGSSAPPSPPKFD